MDNERAKLENYIISVARGHAEGLDGIYAIAGRRMFAVAYSLAGRTAAEDIVHDSLIKIARFAGRYSLGSNPFGWVLKITRNTALDYLRRNRARAEVSVDEFFSLASADYSPEKADDAIMLETAMKKLEKDERQVIYLSYFIDMTVREIAAEMKVGKSSVQRLLDKAEKKLKELLITGQNDG